LIANQPLLRTRKLPNSA